MRTLRLSNELSQSILAEKAEIKIKTLQNYEQGWRLIDSANIETITKLAIALNCPISDLVENDDLREMLKQHGY